MVRVTLNACTASGIDDLHPREVDELARREPQIDVALVATSPGARRTQRRRSTLRRIPKLVGFLVRLSVELLLLRCGHLGFEQNRVPETDVAVRNLKMTLSLRMERTKPLA